MKRWITLLLASLCANHLPAQTISFSPLYSEFGDWLEIVADGTNPDDLYSFEQSDDLRNWTLIGDITAVYEKETNYVEFLPQTNPRMFFRTRSTPAIGTTMSLTNGAILTSTNDISARFRSLVNSGIIYAALYDICEGKTNFLADTGVYELDTASCLTDASFPIDTRRLKRDVAHQLSIFLVDNKGIVDRSGTVTNSNAASVRERWSIPVTVFADNPISLNGFDGAMGWKFYLSFTPAYTNGVWVVTATNNTGTWQRSWSNSFSIAKGGEIIVSDEEAEACGYEGQLIYFRVEVRSENLPILSLNETAVMDKPQGGFGWPDAYGGSFSACQISSAAGQPKLVETARAIQGYMQIVPWPSFDVQTDTWTDSPLGGVANLNSPGDMFKSELVLNGQFYAPPTHVYLGIKGGPIFLGSQNSFPYSVLTPLAPDGWVTNKFTFVILAGCNIPYGIMNRFVYAKTFTREEMERTGKFPRCGIYFKGYPHILGSQDVSSDFRTFWKTLLAALTDKSVTDGRCANTIAQAFEIASVNPDTGNPNPIARYIEFRGFPGMYFDEIYLRR